MGNFTRATPLLHQVHPQAFYFTYVCDRLWEKGSIGVDNYFFSYWCNKKDEALGYSFHYLSLEWNPYLEAVVVYFQPLELEREA